MKKYIAALTAIASVSLAPAAFAADQMPAGQKLSQAQCDSLWMQANPSNAATISESQAKGYLTDFKAANPDNDGSLDKAEFTKACNDGLVSGTASSGTSSGTSN